MKSTRPTNAQKTLTSAEVKQILQELAFVLRLSRGIKIEIAAGARQTVRPIASVADDARHTVCAA